ncbi:MAG: MotA/TolQ/ExbB proton channel family protein [Acidobacteria bacterium]|nr:MotA/TolQ/ExbB proton channel family protein [Acidobacteriota bacterium]
MWETVQNGGWFMVPIGICLLGTVAIFIERLVNLRMSAFMDEELVNRIRSDLMDGNYEAALQVCRSVNNMFHRLLETAINFRSLDQVELRQLIEDQSRQEASYLERFLTSLRTIATIAPLLGLLGTVAGMIKVFHTLSAQGLSEAAHLSGGISEALITTAAGMMVAIPTIVIHNALERRASKIMLRMEKRMIEFMLVIRRHHAVSS